MNQDQYFFMVFLEGGNTPVFKHESLMSAEVEAKRLTMLYSQKAYVLCTLKSFHKVSIVENSCKPPVDDLPF